MIMSKYIYTVTVGHDSKLSDDSRQLLKSQQPLLQGWKNRSSDLHGYSRDEEEKQTQIILVFLFQNLLQITRKQITLLLAEECTPTQ